MRANPRGRRGEAQRQGGLEGFERLDNAVEPGDAFREVPFSPGQSRAHMADPEAVQPFDGGVQSVVVLEIEPGSCTVALNA